MVRTITIGLKPPGPARSYLSTPGHLDPFLDLFFELLGPFLNLPIFFFQLNASFFSTAPGYHGKVKPF